MGWNMSEHVSEYKEAERHVINTAIANGVKPRCEIGTPEQAKYYYDLGVRHFSIGDELGNARARWTEQGVGLREVLKTFA
jgi:2-keto-3-deoxy-L-rhamnonate aldolase RhmA